MLGYLGLDVAVEGLADMLVYVVAVTTLASGASYLITWTRRAARVETSE